ncbi:hypothetical protein M758_UG225400 [Ceratodon purpureus]|nr:hypothetical protein M758_UG225400 [Ceratodon purpureus]
MDFGAREDNTNCCLVVCLVFLPLDELWGLKLDPLFCDPFHCTNCLLPRSDATRGPISYKYHLDVLVNPLYTFGRTRIFIVMDICNMTYLMTQTELKV